MKKIIITEFMDGAAVQWLQARFNVVYDPKLHERRDALRQMLVDADALIVRNRTQVDTDLLDQQTRLRVVGRLGVGLENIDVDVCSASDIKVIPATGANAAAVAEYVICTAMMLLREAYSATDAVMQGQWPRDQLAAGREIAGKTLGLIGLGSVGGRTAQLANAVGMTTIAYDPKADTTADIWKTVSPCADIDSVLSQADVISLHVPLIHATRNLINANRISQMKRGAILINVARGGVVDEAALAASLRNGHLGGAAIDVYTQEPFTTGSVLAGVPRLILTPHIAGVTQESNTRVSQMIAEHVAESIQHH
jgi:(S)-sulfolactate dehydrogenase